MSRMTLRQALEPYVRTRGVRASARRIGMSHSMLVEWISGRRSLSVERLEELVRTLGLRLEVIDDRPQKKAAGARPKSGA